MKQVGLKEEAKRKLEELGFKKVIEKDEEVKTLTRKLAIAYEHYRYVRKEKIDAFNAKLCEESTGGTYKYLAFEKISETKLVPPDNVLWALEEAKKLNCFDDFEIASIQEVKDPIVFGCIDNCSTRFYIAQWDDDVRIEDILKENEG